MTANTKVTFILLFAGFFLSIFTVAEAQRGITYEQLANQQRSQSIFFDYFTLPGSTGETVKFISTFRIDYNLLPFKKVDRSAGGNEFFSPAAMSIEIFRNENAAAENRSGRGDFSISGLEPVDRAMWRDTAYAENYAQTQSKNRFISGHLVSELKPGTYSYILQFIRGEEVDGQMTRRRDVTIKPYQEREQGKVILVGSYSGSNRPERVNLLNFGEYVYYGKDFYTFVRLPGYQDGNEYSYKVNRVEISNRDTTIREDVISGRISSQDIVTGIIPEIESDNDSVYLNLKPDDSGGSYLLMKIPNSTFQNSVYRFEVTRDGQEAPVARQVFRSRWIEMPSSLLNIDVAIEMLRFIVDENVLRQLRSGSSSEKEENFREFWQKRDPTPDTEFNELMAEYYRRIDYAYEEFTTVNVNGYNTDQGQVYVQYGPPNKVERKFPPGKPAVEIWEYGNRTFVFRATSGFGEFELISS